MSDWLYFSIEMGTYNKIDEEEIEKFIIQSIFNFTNSIKLFNESERNKKITKELLAILKEKNKENF